MQVVLKVVGGKNDGREIAIAVPRFVIGRGDTAHLRPASDLVSREHCEIVVGDGKVIINDLESRNGTFVNGKQLAETHIAKSGDSLRIGRLQFEIGIDPAKASVKKPKVEGVVEAASRTAGKNKKQSLEDSITDWLADEEDDPTTAEKQELTSAETIQLNIEETSVFGTTKREREDPEEPAEDPKKKGPMGLPKSAKDQHENSTSAADDVLRKFFNRR